MQDSKPWYLSKTVWASLVTVALALAGMAGLSGGEGEEAALTEALLQGATAVAGLVAILGRLAARSRIG